MGTLTDDRSAAELQAERDARIADEQAKLNEARERLQAETDEEDAAAESAATNGRGAGPHVDAQDGLFDQVIEDSDLEAALEAREKVKASRQALNAKFKEADETAKGLIAALDIETDATVRVGRFRITRASVEGRSVAFETEPTERLTITAAD